MPHYVVTLEEVVTYDIIVEADTPDEAAEAAEEAYCQSENPDTEFTVMVHEREVSNIEEQS